MKQKPKDHLRAVSNLTKFELFWIKAFLALVLYLLTVLFLFFLIWQLLRFQGVLKIYTVQYGKQPARQTLVQFDSCSELQQILEKSLASEEKQYSLRDVMFGLPLAQKSSPSVAELAVQYSLTNIQVSGVDEADIVKTDGKYIYTLSQGNLMLSLAFPVDEAGLLSKTTLRGTPMELFIDGNNVLIFGTRHNVFQDEAPQPIQQPGVGASSGKVMYPYYQDFTFVEIYTMSDPKNPRMVRSLEFEGSYVSSRKVDDYVYFVLNSYPDYRIFNLPQEKKDATESLVPAYREGEKFEPLVACDEVVYVRPVPERQYVMVVGVPMDGARQTLTKKVILGGGQNIYASLEHLYLATTNYDSKVISFEGMISQGVPSVAPVSRENTRVYKFTLDQERIEFLGEGSVPGRVLNQFSMDEYKEHFRIATTIEQALRQGGSSSNNVYVLDQDLKIVGSIEDIAPGEQIHSARFMGDKAYLVTFKKVDPFFVIDVSNPRGPKILGKLKIPGYSDYLHPYDENHIIGIGKEAVEAEEGDFAWYQGLKLALFDVANVTNPREIDNVIIGDRGTDSPILYDHKAMLFSLQKDLLVIPVTLAEIPAVIKNGAEFQPNTYGDFVYQGSYVFSVNPKDGFTLRGRITHYDGNDDSFIKSGSFFGGGDSTIKRNLFIDNLLYSVSDRKFMIHDLSDLTKLREVSLIE